MKLAMQRRRLSMRDVADAAHVSISAVSLVVRGKPGVSAETRQRILGLIESLGYQASASDDGRTPTIGLLIEQSSMPVILDSFYGDIIHGLQAEAQRRGYHMLLHMFDRSAQSLDGLRSRLADEVQGLVVANDGDITSAMIIQLEALRLPLVLIENHLPGQRLPCVLGDNFMAGYAVTRHLLDRGHKLIAILRGPSKYSSLVDRLRGCLAALAEADLIIPHTYMPLPVSGHPQKGYFQMKELLALAERPTAVVAISDKTAFGAMEAIKEVGLRIPHDLAIVSIDNVSESAYTRPPLTSFHIPRTDIGILAMQKLHRQITGESELAVKSIVYGHLVVRESSGEDDKVTR